MQCSKKKMVVAYEVCARVDGGRSETETYHAVEDGSWRQETSIELRSSADTQSRYKVQTFEVTRVVCCHGVGCKGVLRKCECECERECEVV